MRRLLTFLCTLIFGFCSSQSYWFHSSPYRAIEHFAFSGEKIYAAGSGLYVSENYGETWRSIGEGLKGKDIRCLAVLQNTIFIGTIFSHGIYRSTDEGQTWTLFNDSLNSDIINTLAVFDNKVYAGITGGLFVLSDNGRHWRKLTTERHWVFSILKANRKLFIGTQYGVFVSENEGASWNEMKDSLPNGRISVLCARGSKIFAGTDRGIFQWSENNYWIPKNKGLESNYVKALFSDKEDIYAATVNGLYFSSNDGDSWKLIYPDKFPQTYVNYLINSVAKSGNYLFAGIKSEGVYRSADNGKPWQAANEGIVPPRSFRFDRLVQWCIWLGVIILWLAIWVLPYFYLRKLDRGKRIYFFNLLAGLCLLGAVFLFIYFNPVYGWDFTNVILALFALIAWTIWGIVLLILSLVRRRNEKSRLSESNRDSEFIP